VNSPLLGAALAFLAGVLGRKGQRISFLSWDEGSGE
jgi:hypothetical protein